MTLPLLDDLDLAGKRVFCRVDFNVPMDKSGRITDDTRITAALPTLRYILGHGGRLICASHLGRPKGKPVESMRMEPVGVVLADKLGPDYKVLAIDEPCGDGARKIVADARENEIILLENLRFHPGETANDPQFSKELAALADVYVNDAFGAAHRAHASTAGMVEHFKHKAAGFLLHKEVKMLQRLLSNVERPYVALLGGAKVSDKIDVIENLLQRVDVLLIGGAMANTFLKARGQRVGRSLVEEEQLKVADRILAAAVRNNVQLKLPSDVVCAASMDDTQATVADISAIPDDQAAFDIGPQTQKLYAAALAGAKTVFWNGPMGVFEKPVFAAGTKAMAQAVAALDGAFSVVGGGDSVAAITQMNLASRITHVSTGGGASLEFIEGKILPGIAALEK